MDVTSRACGPGAPGSRRCRRAHWASFFPRTIVAEAGSTIEIRVHNRLADHELRIDDLGTTGPISPGGTGSLTVSATVPGTILPRPRWRLRRRILGLPVLVVVAPSDRWRLGPELTEFERQWVWLCQDVDPVWGARARLER